MSHQASRTQILLTKITQICQEICDIKRSKINNIITKLPELNQHHIHIPESSDNYDKDDPDDVYYRNNSSNHPKDRSHSPNTCPLYGQPYAPMLPSPTLSSPTRAHISTPTPESPLTTSFVPSWPSTTACKFDESELEEESLDREKYLVSAVSMNLGGTGRGESEAGVRGPRDPDPDGDLKMWNAPGNSRRRSPSPVAKCE